MGAAVGAAVRGEVLWASEARSDATARRAATFTDVGSVDALAERSAMILSICPPAIAEETAERVFALGFEGIYVDANAISPARMRRIAALGRRVVDGSIIASSGINLYLSGEDAEEVSALMGDGVTAVVVGREIGAASALKMAFGGWNKIGIALTGQAYAIARAYGVMDQLEAEGVTADRLPRMAGRAWRWAPEMEEIADTCAELGLPDQIPRGAAELYRRWEQHRGAAVGLDQLLDDLRA